MSYRCGFVWIAAAAALLAGCAGSRGPTESMAMETATSSAPDSGAIIGDVSPPRERARVHTELAAAYYERGSMGVALEELRIALAADSSYASAYNILGLVHMDLKEYPEAQQSFERGLQIAPNDPDINHNYGWFLCQSDREQLSLRYFLAAIKNPLYATPQKSYALAGACALRKGNHADAHDYFERALRQLVHKYMVLLYSKFKTGAFIICWGAICQQMPQLPSQRKPKQLLNVSSMVWWFSRAKC